MIDAAAHPAPARHRVAPAALWFGLFGAPAAWSIQELAGYSVVSRACLPGASGTSGPWTAGLIVSLVLVVVGVAGGLTAYRAWQRTRPAHRASGPEEEQLEVGEGRARFMAFGGVLVSVVFLLNLLMNFAVLFLVPPCG